MELLLWLIVGTMFGSASMAVAVDGKQGQAFFWGLLLGPVGFAITMIFWRH